MGLYLRKALSVGPFRFNLSKSGVGVSLGIKGFRLGASPRGNYVHMGRGGVYYRSSLPGASGAGAPRSEPSPAADDRSPALPAQAEIADFEKIDSGSVLDMRDSSAASLLEQITTAANHANTWPWLMAVTIGIVIVAHMMGAPLGAVVIIAVAMAGVTAYVGTLDKARSRVVLFYDFEPELEAAYEKVSSAFEALGGAHRIWHKEAVKQVSDTRYTGGAGRQVKSNPIRLHWDPPPMIETNIRIPAIPVGSQVLHFLPDHLLVIQGKSAGAMRYADLEIKVSTQRYLEEQGVPQDAKVVGSTWQYVNKSGGPDRRFKDNREIPICDYEEIHLTSKTGLNECVGLSALGRAEAFKRAVSELAAVKGQ